jgi:predicted HTH transcriptional regulator
MKNNQRDEFQGLFNILILLSFGIVGILIKVIKQGDRQKSEMIKDVPKTSSKKEDQLIEVEVKKESILSGLNDRQNKVIEYLKENGEVTPKELKKIIPSVSTRTIRRDMDKLAEMKLVVQKGSTKSTYYKYIG